MVLKKEGRLINDIGCIFEVLFRALILLFLVIWNRIKNFKSERRRNFESYDSLISCLIYIYSVFFLDMIM